MQHAECQLSLSGPVLRHGLSNCGGRTPNGKPTTVHWYAASIKESIHTRRKKNFKNKQNICNTYLLTHITAANIIYLFQLQFFYLDTRTILALTPKLLNFTSGNPATKYENACSASSSFSFCMHKGKHISLCCIQTARHCRHFSNETSNCC